MNPTEPDPNNPLDAAHPRVEGLARVRGASRGERWFRSLVQNSSDVVMIFEVDGTVRYVSPAMARVLGYRPEEMVGTLAFDYIHPEDLEYMSKSFAQTLEKPGVHPPIIQYRVRAADGSWRYMEAIRSNWLGDPYIGGVVANVRDITERKKAEEALKQSEKYFRSLVQNASDVVLVMEADQTVRYISPAVERVLGYKPEQVVGHDNFTPVHPDDVPRMEKLMGEVMGSPGIAKSPTEVRLRHADGSWRYVETTCTNLLGDPAVGGIVFNSRDVTERKQIEVTLKESEERFRSTFDEASIGMTLNDLDGRFLKVNRSLCEMLGYSEEQLLATTFLTIIPQDDLEESLERMDCMLAGEVNAFQAERRCLHADGHMVWISLNISVVRDQKGKPLYFIGQIQDITERKRTGEALRRSESSLATAQRIAHLGNWDYDITKDQAQWSDEMYRIFGFAPRQFVPRYRTFLNSVHPDDRDLIRRSVRRALYEEKQGSVDYRVVRPDGEVRVVQSYYEVVRDISDRAVKLVGTVHDITERKEAEERRREAEERYRTLVETVPAVTYTDRAVGSYLEAVYTSPQIEALVGYSVEEWLDPERNLWEERLHPEDRKWVLAIDEHSTATGEPFSEEYRLISKDGSVVWVRDEAVLMRSEAGEPLYWQGVLVDVTERKRVEEALRRSEEHFRALTQNSSDVVTLLRATGTIRYQSPSIERILGYGPEETIGDNAFDYVHPDDRERVEMAFAEGLVDPRRRPSVEYRFRHKDGSWVWLESVGTNLLDDPGVGEYVVNSRDVTERKQAEAALREAEERYRTLVEHIPAVTYVQQPAASGALTYVSPQMKDLLGYEPEEYTSHPEHWRKIIHPEDLERVLAEDRRINETGEPFSMEYRQFTKDGSVVWVRDEATLVRDEEGEPLYWLGVQTDVTERKLAEEALKQSEASLVESQRIAHLGTWEWDVATGEVWWSAETYRIHGFDPGEGIPFREKVEEAFFPEDVPLYRKKIDEALSGEVGGYDHEHRIRRPDGEVRWVHGQAEVVRGEGGEPLRMVGTVHDITERKRAEEALRESEERYRLVARATNEVIWDNDLTTGKQEWNGAIQNMFGYSPEEVGGEGRWWEERIHPEDRERVLSITEAALKNGWEMWTDEYRFRRADGTYVTVVDRAYVVHDAEGRPVRLLGSIMDVTERRRAEEEMREANRRLGELATLRADFTAMVAHELDTPLAVIRGYADVIATGELGPDEQERALSRIQAETEILNALVEDVRVAASAEREDFVVNPRRVPVNELLDAAARFVATLPGDHPLILKGKDDVARWEGVRAGYADSFIFDEGAADGREVWADRYRIDQVLRNLLSNAVKYSPEGAPIELRVVPGEAAGRVRIEVIDQGPGIHPDDVKRIFEKFGRGRDRSGRKVAGVGLGLYLSRRLLQAHGSELTLDSTPGGSSVFGFELEITR